MEKFKTFSMGIVILVLGAAASNQLSSLLSFAIISIVCTMGVSLVVWIPAVYGIGWVTLAFVGAVAARVPEGGQPQPERSEQNENRPAPAQPGRGWKEQSAIEQYLARAKIYGLSDEQTATALKAGGWSDAEIQAVRCRSASPATSP